MQLRQQNRFFRFFLAAVNVTTMHLAPDIN